jgi:hypothetical protein
MRFGNPALQKIYDNVVAPTMNNLHHTAEGYIYGVDYANQTVDIFYKEPGGAARQVENVPVPRQADGVFKQDIQIGDRAMVDFKGNDLGSPYITVVYKSNPSIDDYRSKYGGGIPKGIGYF